MSFFRPCKPIKNGVTNYALCFSKSAYVYRWRWFLGKGQSIGTPHGQPTDNDTLDEDNAAQTGYIYGLIQELIGSDFDQTGAVGFFDKAFTSIRLFADLAQRGIAAARATPAIAATSPLARRKQSPIAARLLLLRLGGSARLREEPPCIYNTPFHIKQTTLVPGKFLCHMQPHGR